MGIQKAWNKYTSHSKIVVLRASRKELWVSQLKNIEKRPHKKQFKLNNVQIAKTIKGKYNYFKRKSKSLIFH